MVENVINGPQSARVVEPLRDHLKPVFRFRADIDHWIRLLETRRTARAMLERLEARADADDMVPLGVGDMRSGFQHVRFIGVQAYLSTKWAVADRIAAMAGHVLCIRNQLQNSKKPPQLLTHFIKEDDAMKHTAAMPAYSLRATFGWPIGLSYSLRNHFFHDGGALDGTDFFEGPSATSGFKISKDGWDRVEQRARSYGVDSTHHRVGANWPSAPRDDLRQLLDVCERETDDALGVLIGSACRALVSHVGFIVGEL